MFHICDTVNIIISVQIFRMFPVTILFQNILPIYFFCCLLYLGVFANEAPILKPLLVPTNIEVGDVTEIYCIIKRGSPPMTFKWLHNGKEVNSHSKYKIITTGTTSHFYIGEIEPSDIGNFSCIAMNAFGTDTKMETVSMEGEFELKGKRYLCEVLI